MESIWTPASWHHVQQILPPLAGSVRGEGALTRQQNPRKHPYLRTKKNRGEIGYAGAVAHGCCPENDIGCKTTSSLVQRRLSFASDNAWGERTLIKACADQRAEQGQQTDTRHAIARCASTSKICTYLAVVVRASPAASHDYFVHQHPPARDLPPWWSQRRGRE